VIQSNEIIFKRMANIVIKLHAKTERTALSAIEAKWKELRPDLPFQFKFMDHILDAQYKKERQIEKIVAFFSILSILVACVGLFGLSAYRASRRTKEICIRKVVGAGTRDILVLLSADFTKIVVKSFFIAAPLGWYIMEKWWLQLFAFRTEVNPWILLAIGGSVLLVAWLTVGVQSVRAAVRSPLNGIGSE
jgi:putative ABC transport system permease protein